MDITPFIQAKSDQLNADDLVAGPITVQFTQVSRGNAEQPVIIRLSGGHMPWKPSKTAMRILATAWGTNTEAWVGRWATLYRDPTVRFGGSEVGGIRVAALSHIDRALTLSLAETRGKKKAWKVDALKSADQKQTGAPTADLDALLNDVGLTREDVDRWLVAEGKQPLAEGTAEKRAALAGWLASDPARLDAIRALIPSDDFPE